MYYVDKTVSSGERPQELEVSPTAVYVRKDVEELTEEAEGEERTYYRYKESKYNKDEFIELVTKKNAVLSEEVRTINGAMTELVSMIIGGMS